ncbi:TetR/AcrR family transcriptional regulator [Streptomyces sp. SID1034]|uniref:TetR/AcrR family transcriptional regulator C-terminal ligand-binding domain-containing protein n=1 Tax=Streptomyces sp. SID1034 TaxID=2690248 RepID=UPI00137111EE|nr:TetR family transcriptional regulator [Streptomyces sp. SID1034]
MTEKDDTNEPGPPEQEDRPRRRTGGRSARVREAVLKATAELIAEQGHERIPIAEIAERSGVHQTSIYRRWRTTNAIVLDLSQERLASSWAIPDTGSLRGDLLAYAHGAAESMTGPDAAVLLRALIASVPTGDGGGKPGDAGAAGAAEGTGGAADSGSTGGPGGAGGPGSAADSGGAGGPGDSDAGGIPHPLPARGKDLQDMLDRAVSRGEPRLDLLDVLDGILAPIYLRTLFRIPALDDRYLSSLVDKTLATTAS